MTMHNDDLAKRIMKKEVDRRLRVNFPDLSVGDLVLYRPPEAKIANKHKPIRESAPYRVIGIKGSMISVQRDNRILTRNSSHFKALVPTINFDRDISLSYAKPLVQPQIPQPPS